LLRQLFKKLRLSLNDNAHISLFNGLLGNIILAHFRERYSWEISTRKPSREYDDEFYEKYARTLTNFYLAGVKGVATVAEKIKTNK
jgi:hypothetical protein